MAKEKRKHHQEDAKDDNRSEKKSNIKFKLVKEDSSEAKSNGPILATFPCVKPPPETKFTIYSRKSSKAHKAAKRIIRGSTKRMEYLADNFSQPSGHSRYVVGVYDKASGQMMLKEAPVFHFNATAKALKNLDKTTKSSLEKIYEARSALGETFGTKKAKAALRSRERNQIDSTSLADVAHSIQTDIKDKTESLPSMSSIHANIHADRPIPPPNMEAQKPSEAYNVNDIISEEEFQALYITDILSTRDENERMSYFPFKTSSWINRHLQAMFSSSGGTDTPKKKIDKRSLRLLLYISYLMAFYENRRKASHKKKMRAILNEPAEIIFTKLYERYSEKFAPLNSVGTEEKKSDTTFRVTDTTEVRLLTYTFLLCLMVDNYTTDVNSLASDLSLKLSRASEIFKQLGCQVKSPPPATLAKLNLNITEAKVIKLATLTIPLKFPEVRRRAPGKR